MSIGYDQRAALDVVARVGRDSMPQVRVAVLEQLSAGAEATTPDLANETNLPISTVRLVVEDLTAIGLVARQGEGSTLRWKLTPDGHNTIKALVIGETRQTRKVGRALI
jgi:predicted transcriptional regulator